MNAKRLTAIIVIYVLTTVAWMILSGANYYRSSQTGRQLGGDSDWAAREGKATVQQLWGRPQSQQAPDVSTFHIEKVKKIGPKGKPVIEDVQVIDWVALSGSKINAKIDLEPRRKGLLWYSTYKVKFDGEYRFKNEFANERQFKIRFSFPDTETAYNNVLIHLNGNRVYPGGNLEKGVAASTTLKPGQEAIFTVSYGSQGLDTWHYAFGDGSAVSSVRDFDATIITNCDNIDFPENCISPTHKTPSQGGWNLEWKYGDLISGSNIGIELPQKLNPGPFASRLSLFAPISLLFFFAVLLLIGAVKDVKLHPMHYLLLAATFFSFHLLFSYMVDHVTPFYAFLVSSVVSMLLTISYLRLVVNWKFAVFTAGFWQLIFLVLFTYAFFFEGYTGLTITIGAVVTLAVLMQLTGRVDWEEKLAVNKTG